MKRPDIVRRIAEVMPSSGLQILKKNIGGFTIRRYGHTLGLAA